MTFAADECSYGIEMPLRFWDQITQASPRDARVLADLGRATFIDTFAKDNRQEDIDLYVAETFSTEKQLTEIRDPNRLIEIAWQDDVATGYLHLLKGTPDASVTGPKPIELLRLYVASPWHGKGVGAALMERAIALSREQGFLTLWLGVWERNFRAQAFYEKFGFATVGHHIFRLGTDDQTDLIMTKQLLSGEMHKETGA